MARKNSAIEVEEEYLNKMGPKLGPVYYALYNEVVWIHAVWSEIIKLYGSSENVKLLNQNGSFIFRIIQDSLMDQILLHIARLTDPIQTSGKSNLTIKCLPGFIDDPIIAKNVQNLIEIAIKKGNISRKHRNKRLAHKDFQCAILKVSHLDNINKTQIEEILQAFRDVMNYLEMEYRNSTILFENFICDEDSNQLLYSLSQVATSNAS